MTDWQQQVQDRRQSREKLTALILDACRLDIESDELDPDTPLFGTGLGLDSIDALELVVAVEDGFGVIVADADEGPALALRTVNHLLDRILAGGGA